MGRAPSLLSMVTVTSARPSGARDAVPAKTTSSILPPRRFFTPCSPITQENASTTLDLPDPLGPTTQVIPGSNRSVVAEANDLNPRKVRVFRYTCGLSSPSGRPASLSAPYRDRWPNPGMRRSTGRGGGTLMAPRHKQEGTPEWTSLSVVDATGTHVRCAGCGAVR